MGKSHSDRIQKIIDEFMDKMDDELGYADTETALRTALSSYGDILLEVVEASKLEMLVKHGDAGDIEFWKKTAKKENNI